MDLPRLPDGEVVKPFIDEEFNFSSKAISPEQMLLAAVLRDAVTDFACYDPDDESIDRVIYFYDAKEWIFDDNEPYHPECIKLKYACDMLGIDVDYFRAMSLRARWQFQISGREAKYRRL